MNSEQAIKAWRRAFAAAEKARAALSAHRGAFDDEKSRALRLEVAEAEIALHDAALALDAEDETVAELDALARRAARTFADAQAPPSVAPLESYTAAAVEAHAVAIAASLSKAVDRERAQQTWFATWSAIRSACALYDTERQARGLPPARWYIPANPHDWRELLGPRPAAPRSSWCKDADDLRRELRPQGAFTARRTRGVMPGDLADARERIAT